MAKTENVNLIDTFAEFKELKNIDRSTMISILEESFRSVISKMFGSDENYDVIINPDKGDCEIFRSRTVVEDDELTDPNLSDAHHTAMADSIQAQHAQSEKTLSADRGASGQLYA